jgi:hypothetical protein
MVEGDRQLARLWAARSDLSDPTSPLADRGSRLQLKRQ